MITTERLEELIKQGATIWSNALWYKGKIHLINNDTEEHQLIEGQFGYVYLNHHTKGTDHCYDGDWCLEDLREDVDRAEWEYKTTTERTERFEPPMWEDIKDGYMFGFVNMEKHFGKTITFFVNKNGGFILIEKTGEKEPIWYEPATKENYIKACEIVRDLFNKGNKE